MYYRQGNQIIRPKTTITPSLKKGYGYKKYKKICITCVLGILIVLLSFKIACRRSRV